ncbi:hypothetical protein SDC9_148032 [bioreactor metagenome]|uniref:Uncharacterized protein n=1 Tax=bioreactor metagenome TaxID=1076179 RepID=A0A645EJE4_9ZZZZ|nr:hypothetical protein [Paludibacter sp.]
MELLIIDLKEKLLIRRKNEYEKMQQYSTNEAHELLLISSGKIIELDFIINSMSEMISYYEYSKEITK